MCLAQGHNAVTLVRLEPAPQFLGLESSTRYHLATALQLKLFGTLMVLLKDFHENCLLHKTTKQHATLQNMYI